MQLYGLKGWTQSFARTRGRSPAHRKHGAVAGCGSQDGAIAPSHVAYAFTVLLDHSMAVEERAVQCDRVTHDVDEALAVARGRAEESVAPACRTWRCVHRGRRRRRSSSSPIAQPVTPSMHPSSHQPSGMLRLGTPLRAAFIPLVPDASSGGCGSIQPESTPEVRSWPSVCRDSPGTRRGRVGRVSPSALKMRSMTCLPASSRGCALPA